MKENYFWYVDSDSTILRVLEIKQNTLYRLIKAISPNKEIRTIRNTLRYSVPPLYMNWKDAHLAIIEKQNSRLKNRMQHLADVKEDVAEERRKLHALMRMKQPKSARNFMP